jgi:hypothetical protein
MLTFRFIVDFIEFFVCVQRYGFGNSYFLSALLINL